jgi:hypothetical protein
MKNTRSPERVLCKSCKDIPQKFVLEIVTEGNHRTTNVAENTLYESDNIQRKF